MNKLIGRMLCALLGHKRRKRSVNVDCTTLGSTDILVCPRCWAMWEAKPRAPKPPQPTT